jgi:uncharacterized protein (DUF983 family)
MNAAAMRKSITIVVIHIVAKLITVLLAVLVTQPPMWFTKILIAVVVKIIITLTIVVIQLAVALLIMMKFNTKIALTI